MPGEDESAQSQERELIPRGVKEKPSSLLTKDLTSVGRYVGMNSERETKMAVRFETERYEFSHGKKPRGKGCWYFQFRNGNEILAENASPYGSFTEAKAWARKRARELGAYTAVVMS